MSNLPSTQQRDVVKEISPPWLCTGVNERYMYNLGLLSDSLLEKMNQAMRAHIPGAGTYTANPYLGLDRLLTQGPVETPESFVHRLSRAYQTWQLAGNPETVLTQAYIYIEGFFEVFPGDTPRVLSVHNSGDGVWSTWDIYYNFMNIDDPPAHTRELVDWDWDGVDKWWRVWLVMFFALGGTFERENNWGDPGDWGDADMSWGINQPPELFEPLRNLIRLWKTTSAWYQWFIFSWNGGDGFTGDYNPYNTPGSGNPDATWGRWGKVVNGVYVQSRDVDSRFLVGTSIYVNDCYEPIGT